MRERKLFSQVTLYYYSEIMSYAGVKHIIIVEMAGHEYRIKGWGGRVEFHGSCPLV
jgi:hypothetical protein